ncbi:MAG: hypothetical protein MUC88_00195 [Planctomycetes bacterium]|jgi:hypothetical protein|nr:hypothetical protein [Planctomycetota bacterium]
MKSISRFDYGRNRGWFVRVRWRGRTHSKLFSDRLHGGKRKALDASVAWRDQTEADLGKPRTEAVVQADPADLGGVWRVERRGRATVWVAAWPGGRVSFSVSIHGELGAESLARQARAQGLADYYGSS